jgi:hypothetical protein
VDILSGGEIEDVLFFEIARDGRVLVDFDQVVHWLEEELDALIEEGQTGGGRGEGPSAD